ncbi:MAG: ComEC/Rec2 family competence protein [bacterium]|nr:MAG: ComEC/Rec2 family competence protein [bacterium]
MIFHYISFLVVVFLIFIRYHSTLPNFKNGDEVRITTKVLTEPIQYSTAQYLKLSDLKTYLPKYPVVTYGDTVVVVGTVDGDKLSNPIIEKLETQNRGFLLDFRFKLISFYKSSLPEPLSSLVAGTVIGSKNMPESFWQKLKDTGTAHVVVASGTNVTMTASFLIGLLTIFFVRRTAIWLTLVGIFGYVVISGFDAPIVRAGIMGSILLLGQGGGRLVNTWRILIYSALIMLLFKPSWLTDLGFILSFVATMSLMLFQKTIDLKLRSIPAFFREGLSTSLAAQIGVAPIIFVTFGQFNILSPIINALILWTIPYIMVGGAIAGVLGLVIPLVGRLILFVIFPLLWYFEKVVSMF